MQGIQSRQAFEQAPLLQQQAQLGLQQQQQAVQQQRQQLAQDQSTRRAQLINQSARALRNIDPTQRDQAFQMIAPRLQEQGINIEQFQPGQLTDDLLDRAIVSTQSFIENPALSLEERKLKLRREELEQRRELKELEPELAGQRQREKLSAELDLKPEVTEKVERAKGRAKTATDVIEKSFDRVGKVRTNITNIDRAISALDRGGKSGPFERFLPRINEASRELKQIQNELGLDVIGSVTFGALSEGELRLALDTALDLGQDEPALRDQLVRKKAAQEKLIGYLQEQIDFLDQGGSVAEFLKQKEGSAQQPQRIRFDAQGNIIQ